MQLTMMNHSVDFQMKMHCQIIWRKQLLCEALCLAMLRIVCNFLCSCLLLLNESGHTMCTDAIVHLKTSDLSDHNKRIGLIIDYSFERLLQ